MIKKDIKRKRTQIPIEIKKKISMMKDSHALMSLTDIHNKILDKYENTGNNFTDEDIIDMVRKPDDMGDGSINYNFVGTQKIEFA